MRSLFTFSFLAIAATLVNAQMMDETTGGNALIPEVLSSVELPDGNSAVHVASRGFSWSDSEESQAGNGSIDCYGSTVVNTEGEQLEGAGSCTILDGEGDLWSLWWTGGMSGDWGVTHGTGKYAGMTGGGTWSTQIVYADGRTINEWAGTLTPAPSDSMDSEME